MDTPNDPFVHTTRRVLTVEGEDGQSFVLEDGEPEDVLYLNGARMVRLWQTEQVPTPIPIRNDVTDPGLGRLPQKLPAPAFTRRNCPVDPTRHKFPCTPQRVWTTSPCCAARSCW